MKGKKTLLIILAVVLVVAAATAALLFMPRNVKLDDLTTPASPVTNLIKFGIPDGITEDGSWLYTDSVDFYGVTVLSFQADTSDGSYAILSDDDASSEYRDKIQHFCDYDRSLGSMDIYTYKNLEIVDTGNIFMIDVY